jgi:formylglycine-generating enzyme required for sulfatase activity
MKRPSSLCVSVVFWSGVLWCALAAAPHSANAEPEPGSTFRDCPTCPEMVVVPEGDFLMGSNDGKFDEKPIHRVMIPRPFAVSKYEVTWDEWEACVAEAGCDNEPVTKAGGDKGWGKGRRPVIKVSWHDAQKFVSWLNSKVAGEPYRLLTEAEWEYAARAGTTTQFHWGDTFDPSKANDRNKTVPVGQYAPNRFGLYDMHGNVLEWVEDCYKENYKGAPTDGRPIAEMPDCPRVIRSGAWSYGPRVLRAANRYGTSPGDRMSILGIRVGKIIAP